MPIDLPAKARDWTNVHLDEALRRASDYERAIAAAKVEYVDALARAKKRYEDATRPQAAALKGLFKLIRKAADKLRATWANKSIALPWGLVRFYNAPRHLVLQDGATEASAVVFLESDPAYRVAVIVAKTVSLEVLEKLPADVIERAGYRWVDPRELFEAKTKLTIEAEAQPKLKKDAA